MSSRQSAKSRGHMLASGRRRWDVPTKLGPSLWYGLPTYRQDSATSAKLTPSGGATTLRAFGLSRWKLGFRMIPVPLERMQGSVKQAYSNLPRRTRRKESPAARMVILRRTDAGGGSESEAGRRGVHVKTRCRGSSLRNRGTHGNGTASGAAGRRVRVVDSRR